MAGIGITLGTGNTDSNSDDNISPYSNNFNKLSDIVLYGNFGACTSFNGDGTRLAVGAPSYSNTTTNSGLVKIYDYSSNEWEEIGSIEGNENDYYGYSLKLSYDGTTLIVGPPKTNSAGVARVYEYNNISLEWDQKGGDISGNIDASLGEINGEWDRFGYSVSTNYNGSIVAIGAPYYESPWYYPYTDSRGDTYFHVGCVYVYDYNINNNTWDNNVIYENTKDDNPWNVITPRRYYDNLYSGASIDMNYDGTIIAASIPGYYKGGSVMVVENTGNNSWNHISTSDGITLYKSNDINFGCSISLNKNGNKIAIGANYDGNTPFTQGHYGPAATNEGLLSVWEYDSGTNWNKLCEIHGNDDDEFGYSVSLNDDGTIVAASAYSKELTSDKYSYVKVYEYDSGTNWNQLGANIDGNSGDQFGYDGVGTGHNSAISINNDGTILAIGAIGNNSVRTYNTTTTVLLNNSSGTIFHSLSITNVYTQSNILMGYYFKAPIDMDITSLFYEYLQSDLYRFRIKFYEVTTNNNNVIISSSLLIDTNTIYVTNLYGYVVDLKLTKNNTYAIVGIIEDNIHPYHSGTNSITSVNGYQISRNRCWIVNNTFSSSVDENIIYGLPNFKYISESISTNKDDSIVRLITSQPQNNSTTVAFNSSMIVLYFTKPVYMKTGEKIELKKTNHVNTKKDILETFYASSKQISGNETNTIIIKPSIVFEKNTQYHVIISDNMFSDEISDEISDNLSFSFTTNDSILPTLISHFPTHNETNIPITSNIYLSFSETIHIDPNGTIELYFYNGSLLYKTIHCINEYVTKTDKDKIMIKPLLLLSNTKYYIQISHNSFYNDTNNYYQGITDKTTFTFTTGS